MGRAPLSRPTLAPPDRRDAFTPKVSSCRTSTTRWVVRSCFRQRYVRHRASHEADSDGASFHAHSVTNARLRENVSGLSWVDFKLVAKAANLNSEMMGVPGGRGVPDLF